MHKKKKNLMHAGYVNDILSARARASLQPFKCMEPAALPAARIVRRHGIPYTYLGRDSTTSARESVTGRAARGTSGGCYRVTILLWRCRTNECFSLARQKLSPPPLAPSRAVPIIFTGQHSHSHQFYLPRRIPRGKPSIP